MIFSRLINFIKGVIRKLIPYKNIEAVEHVETPLSTEMMNAIDLWYDMYRDKAPWLAECGMKSLNLPAFICSEVARQVTLELKWNITGKSPNGDTRTAEGNDVMNPRAQYLKDEFEKCVTVLRQKLEQGCAAGGMTIKPYPKDGHIYFDWTMDWSLYPIAFDDDGGLADVIFRDSYTEGKNVYTRLERHTVEGKNVRITQRVFKSSMKDSIGVEVSLSDVPIWSQLAPEAVVEAADGQMFGWFKVAAANSVDIDSPMGSAVFSKAVNVIHDADEQYSRLMWEFEGSELAIDVDPTSLRPRADGKGMEMPKLNDRLFRGVDLGDDDNYHVFSPAIRDASLLSGLGSILSRVEDLCGLSRGSLTDAPSEARTATELRLLKQRSYATIADNQAALERCLRSVIRSMDKYATLYHLAPEGEYDVSFNWDDSIITDTEQQMNERLLLLNAGCSSRAELRQWYFGETPAQAKAAIKAVTEEKKESMTDLSALLPNVTPDE